MAKREIVIGRSRPGTATTISEVFEAPDDHEWWSDLLEAARTKARRPPAAVRIRAASAAVDEVEGKAL
jgi:hypothetical protein